MVWCMCHCVEKNYKSNKFIGNGIYGVALDSSECVEPIARKLGLKVSFDSSEFGCNSMKRTPKVAQLSGWRGAWASEWEGENGADRLHSKKVAIIFDISSFECIYRNNFIEFSGYNINVHVKFLCFVRFAHIGHTSAGSEGSAA